MLTIIGVKSLSCLISPDAFHVVLNTQNETGTGSGDAYVQCSACHIYCLEGAPNAVVVSDHSCCPAFGIEIVGPHVRWVHSFRDNLPQEGAVGIYK